MKQFFNWFNVVLALVLVAQIRAWLTGYSNYLFMATFVGLLFLYFGTQELLRWHKHKIAKRVIALAIVCIGVAIFFEYEPVVGSLFR